MDAKGNGEFALQCVDLAKEFRIRGRPLRVLDGVQLDVRRGEVVLVTGRTGCGKSTLLGLLGGLDRPTAGRILLGGRRVDDLPAAEWSALRRRHVGYLFQHFNLLPSWTALENVEAALFHSGLPRAARQEKAAAMLGSLGLGQRLDHLPAELSVGQQQLVAVARALVGEPAVLLADEPTGDVDDQMAGEILQALLGHVRGKGAAMVVATHGPFPLSAADRAFRLADGRLAGCAKGP